MKIYLTCLMTVSTIFAFCYSEFAYGLSSEQIAFREYIICSGEDKLIVLYESDVDITVPNSNVKRVVVAIHGSSRTAVSYHDKAMDGTIAAGLEGETLVFAPQFLKEEDLDLAGTVGHDNDKLLYWKSGSLSWTLGFESQNSEANPRKFQISSYKVLDMMLKDIAANNPGLESIVITGFSGGGQYVSRYAAGSPAEDDITGVSFKYIVGGPSTQMYFSGERFLDNKWEYPAPSKDDCNGTYNNYRHGIEKLNAYMSRPGVEGLIVNYKSRNVIVLAGEDDNDPNDESLLIDCASMLQGKERVERAALYHEHIQRFFGPDILKSHDYNLVADKTHVSSTVLKTDCAIFYIHGHGNPLEGDFSCLWEPSNTQTQPKEAIAPTTTSTTLKTTTTLIPTTTIIPVLTTTTTIVLDTTTTTVPTTTATTTTSTTSTTSTTLPTTKSFTFNCEHSMKRGFFFGLETLTMNLGDTESCTLKLTNHEPDKTVEVSSQITNWFWSGIKIEPARSVTDENGELKITITAISKGTDWVAWAVPNDKGQFLFNMKTYDTGLAWGMFVEVK
ncbi:MAG: hypothetical protein ACUZ8H_09670 [Candidatus Anammoxibacter sp.]